MPRNISWNFFKVTLLTEDDFPARKEILKERFQNADIYLWTYGDTTYRYEFYDLEFVTTELTSRDIVFGRITRKPKTARGRRLNEKTHQSSDDSVNIDEIADATEFVYDFGSCVFALHRRSPFYANRTTAKAIRGLLGLPYDSTKPDKVDVHVEIMRDEEFAVSLLDSSEDLREVRLTFAKPNPGSGDNILNDIHLGLIGEDTLSDEIIFDAKKKSGGSLKKTGFLRTSISKLLGLGYLKKGYITLSDKRHDLLQAGEKTRETVGYSYDDTGQPNSLTIDVDVWLKQLREENNDVYPQNEEDE
jgi:hypothetical protein